MNLYMIGASRSRSVLLRHSQPQRYMPFGQAAAIGGTLAFNGEYAEPGIGLYLLGQGYRGYAPTLQRFTSADRFSPFGKGGLNAYAYVGAEPINRVDPTGQGISSVLGPLFAKRSLKVATSTGRRFIHSSAPGMRAAKIHHYTSLKNMAEILPTKRLRAGMGNLGHGAYFTERHLSKGFTLEEIATTLRNQTLPKAQFSHHVTVDTDEIARLGIKMTRNANGTVLLHSDTPLDLRKLGATFHKTFPDAPDLPD